MAYSELIKNFETVREYMREFYVYGFKSREEYNQKSLRSYDDEKRRVESWLGEYMNFRQTKDGKRVFLSIDSRKAVHNPLFKAWKTKSFTDGDITLHFILFDILHDPCIRLSIKEILKITDGYLSAFENPMTFDESTLRKKINEYIEEGLMVSFKQGRGTVYARAETPDFSFGDALSFYSEVAPCGVVGSFMLDRKPELSPFTFKHHYITQTLDSEVLCELLQAIGSHREVTLENYTRKSRTVKLKRLLPLKIFVSVQSGRQYLAAVDLNSSAIISYRLDYIRKAISGEVCDRFEEWVTLLEMRRTHTWGVTFSRSRNLQHVEFTVRFGPDEEYIYRRLLREKRCGEVTRLDGNTARFTAELYDTGEIVPWVRTFIGRIISLKFSNRTVENRLKADMAEMYRMYGLYGLEEVEV